jgi:hypothetical protein
MLCNQAMQCPICRAPGGDIFPHHHFRSTKMLRSFHHAPGFDETHRETNPAGRSAPPTAASSWPTVAALRTMCDALREGLAAYRQYEHLRSRGIPHKTAIRQALGVGLKPSRQSNGPTMGMKSMQGGLLAHRVALRWQNDRHQALAATIRRHRCPLPVTCGFD